MLPFLKCPQEFVASAARHLPITEHEIRIVLDYYWQSLSRIFRLQHFELAGAENLSQRDPEIPVIIDNQNPAVHHSSFFIIVLGNSALPSIGRLTLTIVPPGDAGFTTIRPPCACTISYAIDSPSPVPFARVVKNGSNTLPRISSG